MAPLRPGRGMTAAELERFIERSAPGERATYYVGHLAHDRVYARNAISIDHAAAYAADHSVGERFRMSDCGHVRTVIVGSGELRLEQNKLDTGAYNYAVVKR